MKTMIIEWPELDVKVEAVLEDVRNAELIDEIWANLPMTSIQEHAMVTGKSMYCWAPMISLAEIPFQMEIKDTPPGVVSYSQKTGNKLIVRYGKVTEDLMTPIVGFIDPKHVPEELFTRLKTYFNEEQIVVITAMGVMMIANNYFNDILDVTPDHLA